LKALEGSLQTAKLFYGISDKKFEELIKDLDKLLEAVPTK
jgi:hypothetical protein